MPPSRAQTRVRRVCSWANPPQTFHSQPPEPSFYRCELLSPTNRLSPPLSSGRSTQVSCAPAQVWFALVRLHSWISLCCLREQAIQCSPTGLPSSQRSDDFQRVPCGSLCSTSKLPNPLMTVGILGRELSLARSHCWQLVMTEHGSKGAPLGNSVLSKAMIPL